MPRGDLNILPISDLADPRIADYAGLKDAQLKSLAAGPEHAPGVFLAEGELVVRQLLASGLHIRSVLLTPARLESMRPDLSGLPQGTPVYLAEQPVMNGVVGFNIHRGILAAGQRPAPLDLPSLLKSAQTLVLLEDLANHDNIGGIFRATAALAGLPRPEHPGGAAILLSPRCCDPLYRKAIRVSMGTALRLPFARLHTWPDSLAAIREAGFTLIALTPAPGAVPISELDRNRIGRPALLLGAEGPGLSPAALAAADLKVRIPIDPSVDSLNVVVAAGIALAALARWGE